MTVLTPRVRTVGVRLSEQEYEALRRFCLKNGARSVSDLAREAICDFIAFPKRKMPVPDESSRQEMYVKRLERKVDKLSDEIAQIKQKTV